MVLSVRKWVAVFAVVFSAQVATAAPTEKPKDVDLVICLDVSGSMNGLIDSAKVKLWDIVNELAKVKPTPNLRVGLYSYGHDTYPAANGWVRKDLDLTNDLDEVYAKLNALTINGGEEYVARVSQAALKEQKWAVAPNALRLIFVCGNEPADQDKAVKLADVASLAKSQGVIINTIFCGPAQHVDAAGWRDFSIQTSGSYANIDQNQAKNDLASNIKSPFDEKLLKLNGDLNKTYVAYGEKGKASAEKQVAQDTAAAANAPGAALGRAESKANPLYTNSTWDLIDRMKDAKFDLATIKDEDLPECLKTLKPEERMPYLKKKADERTAIQKEINDLSGNRGKFIDDERKKLPKTTGEKSLDDALKGMIREQAKAKGFEVPTAEKK